MQYPLVHMELIHHPVDHNQIEHVRKSVQPIEINVSKRKQIEIKYYIKLC